MAGNGDNNVAFLKIHAVSFLFLVSTFLVLVLKCTKIFQSELYLAN